MKLPFVLPLFGEGVVSLLVQELCVWVITYIYYLYLKKRLPDVHAEQRNILLFVMIIGAIAGSKLFQLLNNQILGNQMLFQGIVVYSMEGALVGGCAAIALAKRVLRIKTPVSDLFCFPVIGCFALLNLVLFFQGSHGLEQGNVTSSFLGLDAGDGMPRHEVMIYEFMLLCGLFFCLKLLQYLVPLTDGALFQLFILFYSLWRLFARGILLDGGLEINPITLLLFILISCYLLYCLIKNGARNRQAGDEVML